MRRSGETLDDLIPRGWNVLRTAFKMRVRSGWSSAGNGPHPDVQIILKAVLRAQGWVVGSVAEGDRGGDSSRPG